MAALTRQKAQAERDLDVARAAGDEEGFRDHFKRVSIIDDQIEHLPHLLQRWVDATIADCDGTDEIRDSLQATITIVQRRRLDAITRGDHLAAERADDAIEALKSRLVRLLH
jgi:hypothetical protein